MVKRMEITNLDVGTRTETKQKMPSDSSLAPNGKLLLTNTDNGRLTKLNITLCRDMQSDNI
ncbi:hypothetical protein M513_02267 [Trichuris suis]|uniref:Uncharacterized protein n=1 Tax=Trichuris suis TaxID=68888 RepID=A0A085MIG4_9BILA|nr:hypothetical protein M513_02267 [Trichuris suis]